MQVNSKNTNECSLPTVKKLLETKVSALEQKLNANMHQKQVLELRIHKELEKIKKMRASLEKLDAICRE